MAPETCTGLFNHNHPLKAHSQYNTCAMQGVKLCLKVGLGIDFSLGLYSCISGIHKLRHVVNRALLS